MLRANGRWTDLGYSSDTVLDNNRDRERRCDETSTRDNLVEDLEPDVGDGDVFRVRDNRTDCPTDPINIPMYVQLPRRPSVSIRDDIREVYFICG